MKGLSFEERLLILISLPRRYVHHCNVAHWKPLYSIAYEGINSARAIPTPHFNSRSSKAMAKRSVSSVKLNQSCCEPLIPGPDRCDGEGRDLEAVKNGTRFSLLNYFCFFVIGLSMMWTW